MQLDQAAVRLRSREPWEAADLGTAMLRAWWRAAYGATLTVVLPVTLILHVLLTSWPWLALLITWWLKPLYDRILLHVFAHAVFGAPPRIVDTVANWRHLIGSTSLLPALLWGRLDSARAFNLPVHQLEGQRGSAARERRVVLGRRGTPASAVLYLCLLFETMGWISLAALVDLVTPATLEAEYGLQAFFRHLYDPNAPAWAVYVNHAFYVAAMCAIEPLYVACSFALYLNRRTLLEAWDLELSFRRMAQRARAASVIAAVLALAVFAPVAQDARAAEPAPRDVIREVLAAPEFQEHRKERVWQRRASDDREPSTLDLGALGRALQYLSDLLAGAVRFAVYLFLAVGAFFLLRYLVRNLRRWTARPDGNPRAPPAVLFGLDVRPEALPEDLAQVAAVAAQSDPRLALSLLYRGALATLIHRDRIEFAAGDTEADCVRRIDRVAPAPLGAYFRRLVRAWSEAAYAQRIANAPSIRALCEEWQIHFGPRGEPS